jgi:Yip1-like protein
MNCPKCNHPSDGNARFCSVCGQPLPAASAAAGIAPAPEAAAATAGGASIATSPEPSSPTAGIIERAKNIILTPKTEWPLIAAEATPSAQLYLGYVLPLAAFAIVITALRLVVIGTHLPFGTVVRTPLSGILAIAVWGLVGGLIGWLLFGWIVNLLAPTFGGTRDFNRALKVAAYSLTPAYLGSVLALSPVLPSLLQFAALCYGLYVLYLGLPVLMRSPQERAGGYTAMVVVCCFVLGFVLMFATAGLGIFTHSGLYGSRSASSAASADQSAAVLGNGVGAILGTDAKGKAGITAAVSNLIKAGEQQDAADKAANSATPGTAAADNSAAATQNAGAAVGGLVTALGGALGGDHPKAAVDIKALTPLLPTDLPGMTRTAANGEQQGAAGIKTTSATGSYQGSSGTVKIVITDMTAVAGLMGMASALAQNTTSESDTGFEREQVVDGHSVHEKYDAPTKHGELTVLVAKRYQVDMTGNGVDMKTLEQDLGQIDLGRLEAMKDQGSPPQ